MTVSDRAAVTRDFLDALGAEPRWLADILREAGLTLDQGCDVLRRGLASGHLTLVGNGNEIQRVQL